jgi:hypothetical protein
MVAELVQIGPFSVFAVGLNRLCDAVGVRLRRVPADYAQLNVEPRRHRVDRAGDCVLLGQDHYLDGLVVP